MSKAWDSIAGDFEQAKREVKNGEYSIVAVGGVGRIACYRPGLQLMDFYRTSNVLAKDVPGRSGMNSEVTGKSERDRQMEETPPATVNPSTPKL